MFRKIFISFLIVLAAVSCFAFLHFNESEHIFLSKEISQQKWNAANPGNSLLQTGDLIFRHSRGAISNMLMSFSQHEKKYSHAGIISKEDGNVFVYHAIGGEENKSNKMRKDLLSVFCNPSAVHSFGIYRLNLDKGQLEKVDSMIKENYRRGLEFDTKFDLATDDKMYCSEFVYKTILKAVNDPDYLSLSQVSGKKYVSCDDLYLNSHCRNIYSYEY
jgi:hypothetical protein